MNEKTFSATEVGTLIERFETHLSLVSERTGTLCHNMLEVKEKLGTIEKRVITLEDAVRLTFPRIARIEAKIDL